LLLDNPSMELVEGAKVAVEGNGRELAAIS